MCDSAVNVPQIRFTKFLECWYGPMYVINTSTNKWNIKLNF